MEIWRERNQATTIYFPLIDRGTLDFESTPVTFAAGDTQFSVDGGVFANTTNNPAHEGNGIYSLALVAAEVNGQNTVITLIDSATKAWEDQAIVITTYGDASAEHAVNLNDATRAGLTALPNAAADAAGGLPISDAGGLDLDARLDAAVSSRLAPTVAGRTLDITATGAAGIDWGNVENPTTALDLSGTDIQLCDTVTTNTDMRGTDSAALASVCTEARLAELDAANLPTTTDNIETDTQDIQARLPAALVGGRIDATVDATGMESGAVSNILTTAMTESYAADGSAPTLAQALMMIQQMLGDFAISGTTLTVRQVDGATTAATFTLDDATNPTDLTRAT